MNIKRKIAELLVKIPFIYKAIKEKADLSEFKEKPERHIMIKNFFGLFLILFSYALGWPVVLILGIISMYWGEPLFVVIGGPIAYGVSHIVFGIGMYITGAHYTHILLRWMVRSAVEKVVGKNIILSAIINKNKSEGAPGNMEN